MHIIKPFFYVFNFKSNRKQGLIIRKACREPFRVKDSLVIFKNVKRILREAL